MNREIKFRAWNKLTKHIFDVQSIHFEGSIVRNGSSTFYKTEDVVLMQYTGLKDKNGDDIYDQYLLSHNGNVFKVMWSDDFSGWCYVYYLGDCRERPITKMFLEECELIGNIYLNPELLKEV